MSRITLINRYFFPDESATSQLLTDLALHLVARGFEVVVVASRQRIDDPRAALPEREICQGVEVHRVWTTSWGRTSLPGRAVDYLTFYLSAAWRLLSLVRRGDLVLAKTDPPLIGLVAGVVARLKGAAAINWWQDVYPEVAERLAVPAARLLGRPLRWVRGWVLRTAARNVVIGRCMRAYLITQGADAARIAVIPNWVDDVAIRPLPRERNPLRGQWGLADRFVVGYSGNLGRSHEFDTLLEVARRLAPDPGIAFLIVGSGARLAEIEGRCRELGLDNVLFRPFQPREWLPQSLSVPDLHIVSLRSGLEGLVVPSKFYGALAAGRPVLFLGPDTSEVALAIRQHRCGFVVADGSSADAAHAISRCAAEPELRRAMGERARQAVDEHYSRSAALRAWEATLEQAARGLATGRPAP